LLLNKARQTHRPFDELLQYYAMERFFYRISNSPSHHLAQCIAAGGIPARRGACRRGAIIRNHMTTTEMRFPFFGVTYLLPGLHAYA
jgi:hypothetical protein